MGALSHSYVGSTSVLPNTVQPYLKSVPLIQLLKEFAGPNLSKADKDVPTDLKVQRESISSVQFCNFNKTG